MSEELREVARLSPDSALVAVRRGPNDWRVSNGGHYRDVHVADWTPLTPLPEMAALIADAERVRRVRELAEEYGRNATLIRNSHGGADDVILRWVAFVDAATSLRRALDGDQ